MSYHAPKMPAPEKPQDPLINMGELQQATDLQTSQRGMISTYIAGMDNKAKIANYIQNGGGSLNYTGRTIAPNALTSGKIPNPSGGGSSKRFLGSSVL